MHDMGSSRTIRNPHEKEACKRKVLWQADALADALIEQPFTRRTKRFFHRAAHSQAQKEAQSS
jgi:hypothetical protein